MAIPLVLQQLVTFSVGLVDSVMVGTLGDYVISGVHICNQVFTVFQMIIIGVNSAILIFTAQYWGKQDVESIKRVLSIGGIFSVGISMLFLVVCSLWPVPILSMFSKDVRVLHEAGTYMQVICFTYPLFALSQVLVSVMRAVENVQVGVISSVSSLLLNTALNYVLIFGVDIGGIYVSPKGIYGAAVATLTARLIEAAIMVVYVFFLDKKVDFRVKDIQKPEKRMTKHIAKYGLPIIGAQFVWGINMLGQSMILGHMSTSALAAFSIVGVMSNFLYVAKEGLGQAVSVITSKTIGSGDYERMKWISYRVQIIFLALGLVSCLEIVLLRDLFISWYNVEPETAETAKIFLNVLAITIIGGIYQSSCLSGLVKAGGDTAFVLKNDAFFVFCIVLPCSALAAFVFQAPDWIVFACLKCDQVLKCFVAVVKINRFKWMKNITEVTEKQPDVG